MKRSERWFCLAIVLVTFNTINGAAPFKKVALVTNAKGTTTSTTAAAPSPSSVQEESFSSEGEDRSENGTASGQIKNSKLTGIPQIDYIWDPNLPRELRGYNLSSYPFFSSVPPEEDIHFKCDGLHDGFYASIEHKCQLYHHCVYGIRHDFLCANFTAFDQKTFICHFVSDVDCEGSQKYWNRNDDLYMATTTTSTTTTTTEPPPTPPRRRPARPLRPLRRPVNRRPLDDYYYDEEDEYDDDYYEEVIKRRRKQRPRHHKPMVDYEDEYEDEKRPVEVKPRRGNSRDRFRDDLDVEPEEDYEIERRKLDRPKSRTKASPAAERRKISSRKPGTLVGRSNVEERRSLTEDRPISGRKRVTQTIPDESSDPVELPSRRTTGRKRLNERRTSSIATDLEDVDEYEKSDQEEAVAFEDEVPVKVKTTPKPLEEFITPKAAPSSVYARPRAPPRISRPVPMNEKKKFQYPVQKTGTTVRPSSAVSPAQDDESEYYDEEEDYADIHRPRGKSRRRLNSETIRDDDDEVLPPVTRQRKQKPPRTLRKPGVSKKATTTAAPLLEEEEEDYDIEERYVGRGGTRRKNNNFTGRTRGRIEVNDDVDFVDDDYDERPLQRSRPNGRKGIKKPRPPPAEVDPEEFEEEPEIKPQRGRANVKLGRRKPATVVSRTRGHTAQVIADDEVESEQTEELDDPPTAVAAAPGKSQSATSSRSAAVRVVKRPFLPSRGGSPYLPRGLQSVGVSMKSFDDQTTDRNQGTVQINMGSTISGVHLLEHGVPLLRESGPLRTTLPPRSPIPISKTQPEPSPPPHQPSKATLDELYETDYDVTLNDALNPTLKPLSPHQSLHHQQHYLHQANQSPNSNSNNNNRSYPNGVYSPSPPPQPPLPSETSFAYSSNNNQSPPSPVVINHHVHHHQLPSSSSQAQSSNHHLQVPAQSPTQAQAQTYHLHHRHPLPPQSQPHVQLQQQQQQQQQSQSLLQLQQQQPQQTNESNNNNFNSDSYFSSTDIRRRTIASAPQAQSSRYVAAYNSRIGSSAQQQQQQQQQSQNYYDEYEY